MSVSYLESVSSTSLDDPPLIPAEPDANFWGQVIDATMISTGHIQITSNESTIDNLNQLIKMKDETIKKLSDQIKSLEEMVEDVSRHKSTNNRMDKILE